MEFMTTAGPVQLTALFLVSSMVMVWRLNAVEQKGFEGTMVGTLIMPYCSGFANLAFAFVMGRSGGAGSLVLENCIVNNVTNLTLILGITALFGGMRVYGKSGGNSKDKTARIGWISLLLTITALFFFTGAVWTLARDGQLDFYDGLMLCGLFAFWQVIHLFEVMKNNVRKKQRLPASLIFDLALAGLAAWACLYSIEGLVAWVTVHGKGWLSIKNLGVLSGILMVIPNGLLAFYYAGRGRADIAYSSQIGDCHICIPLCIGLYALFTPISLPASFMPGIIAILAAGCAHLVFTTVTGRIPRLIGGGLALGYAIFIYKGASF
ncbi:MAG: sodium:calcium symporter [Desulfobacter sp.]|nr:MAG: sodium:calcium symporter [Desulfobacter sp.]